MDMETYSQNTFWKIQQYLVSVLQYDVIYILSHLGNYLLIFRDDNIFWCIFKITKTFVTKIKMCQNEKGSSEKNENKLAEKVVPHSNADHYNIFSDTIHSEKHCNSDL